MYPTPQRCIEFALTFGGLAVLGVLVFKSVQSAHPIAIPALICLPLPLLLWATLRFGPTGASLSLLLVGVLCIRGVMTGFGPFALGGSPEDNARAIQYFLLALYVPKLCLAVWRASGRTPLVRFVEAKSWLGSNMHNWRTFTGTRRLGWRLWIPTWFSMM